MSKPNITLTITNRQMVSFRINSMPPHNFKVFLAQFQKHFLAKDWNGIAWELPLNNIQSLYQFCRNAVGSENIKIVYEDHITKNEPRQLKLLE